MVQSGGFSASDFRDVFKRHIEKRVRSLPEIDGLSKETVLSSWMAKFDTIYRGDEDPRKAQQRMTASAASELILSKDQLYEMFQNILGIKKFEHQLLYQACQVRSEICIWNVSKSETLKQAFPNCLISVSAIDWTSHTCTVVLLYHRVCSKGCFHMWGPPLPVVRGVCLKLRKHKIFM